MHPLEDCIALLLAIPGRMDPARQVSVVVLSIKAQYVVVLA